MTGAHPDVEIGGICDSSGYILSVLGKYTGMPTYPSMESMLQAQRLDGVVVSTPSHLHAPIVREAAAAGVHIFCEKPFCLDADDGRELAELTAGQGLVTQVGYHNRFVAAFAEVKRLLDAGAIGQVTHVLAEAYGPVVLKPQGSSLAVETHRGWRLALRLRSPSPQPAELVLRRAQPGTRDRPRQGVLPGDRRRGVQHAVVPRRGDRSAVGQLERRVTAQDDHEGDHLGHPRPDLRRPPGVPGLPA